MTMIDREQFIQSLLKEVRIYQHLFTKVDQTKLEYRPTEKQRSTLELLQYIAHVFSNELNIIKTGRAINFSDVIERSRQMTADQFLTKMDALATQIPLVVNGFSEHELDETIDLFGRGGQTRRAWLLELILKNMVGYKMQLFLYIKASGNSEIGTADLWRGQSTLPRS